MGHYDKYKKQGAALNTCIWNSFSVNIGRSPVPHYIQCTWERS